MLTIKQGIKISAIIDKMDIKIKATEVNEEGKTVEKTKDQIGADLIIQITSKAYKAESEIYALVAEIKGCSIKEAENVDLIQWIKDIAGNSDLLNFFKSAVK